MVSFCRLAFLLRFRFLASVYLHLGSHCKFQESAAADCAAVTQPLSHFLSATDRFAAAFLWSLQQNIKRCLTLLRVTGLVGGLERAGPWVGLVEGPFPGPGLVGLVGEKRSREGENR